MNFASGFTKVGQLLVPEAVAKEVASQASKPGLMESAQKVLGSDASSISHTAEEMVKKASEYAKENPGKTAAAVTAVAAAGTLAYVKREAIGDAVEHAMTSLRGGKLEDAMKYLDSLKDDAAHYVEEHPVKTAAVVTGVVAAGGLAYAKREELALVTERIKDSINSGKIKEAMADLKNLSEKGVTYVKENPAQAVAVGGGAVSLIGGIFAWLKSNQAKKAASEALVAAERAEAVATKLETTTGPSLPKLTRSNAYEFDGNVKLNAYILDRPVKEIRQLKEHLLVNPGDKSATLETLHEKLSDAIQTAAFNLRHPTADGEKPLGPMFADFRDFAIEAEGKSLMMTRKLRESSHGPEKDELRNQVLNYMEQALRKMTWADSW